MQIIIDFTLPCKYNPIILLCRVAVVRIEPGKQFFDAWRHYNYNKTSIIGQLFVIIEYDYFRFMSDVQLHSTHLSLRHIMDALPECRGP
jgi:hypothetical protein